MDKEIQTGEAFARLVADSIDMSKVDELATKLQQSLPQAERESPQAAARCLVRAIAHTAANQAHDRLVEGIDGLGAALGRANVAMVRLSESLSGLAMQYGELSPQVDAVVEDLCAIQAITSPAWDRLATLVAETVAEATGLGRKVVTGQSQLTPTSVRELLDIAAQMTSDGEAHPMLVFLYGGGEDLSIQQMVRLHDDGKFSVVGLRSPGELECERYVAWARSRAKLAMERVDLAQATYGYPCKAAIEFVYNGEGEPL